MLKRNMNRVGVVRRSGGRAAKPNISEVMLSFARHIEGNVTFCLLKGSEISRERRAESGVTVHGVVEEVRARIGPVQPAREFVGPAKFSYPRAGFNVP
jgi:hypothetical protein